MATRVAPLRQPLKLDLRKPLKTSKFATKAVTPSLPDAAVAATPAARTPATAAATTAAVPAAALLTSSPSPSTSSHSTPVCAKSEEQSAPLLLQLGIPASLRIPELRAFFSPAIEDRQFRCFHFRRGKSNGEEDKGENGRTGLVQCLVAVDDQAVAEDVMRVFNGVPWREVLVDCNVPFDEICHFSLADSCSQMLDLHREQLHPPLDLPYGNVGTPRRLILRSVAACRLPPSIVQRLGLSAPIRKPRSSHSTTTIPPPACLERGRRKALPWYQEVQLPDGFEDQQNTVGPKENFADGDEERDLLVGEGEAAGERKMEEDEKKAEELRSPSEGVLKAAAGSCSSNSSSNSSNSSSNSSKRQQHAAEHDEHQHSEAIQKSINLSEDSEIQIARQCDCPATNTTNSTTAAAAAAEAMLVERDATAPTNETAIPWRKRNLRPTNGPGKLTLLLESAPNPSESSTKIREVSMKSSATPTFAGSRPAKMRKVGRGSVSSDLQTAFGPDSELCLEASELALALQSNPAKQVKAKSGIAAPREEIDIESKYIPPGIDEDSDTFDEPIEKAPHYEKTDRLDSAAGYLYEDKVEDIWDKHDASGLVHYTDAAFWDAQAGEMDERCADSWDVDPDDSNSERDDVSPWQSDDEHTKSHGHKRTVGMTKRRLRSGRALEVEIKEGSKTGGLPQVRRGIAGRIMRRWGAKGPGTVNDHPSEILSAVVDGQQINRNKTGLGWLGRPKRSGMSEATRRSPCSEEEDCRHERNKPRDDDDWIRIGSIFDKVQQPSVGDDSERIKIRASQRESNKTDRAGVRGSFRADPSGLAADRQVRIRFIPASS